MNGKLVGAFLVISALLFGGFVYYQQVYAYYRPLDPAAALPGLTLVPVAGGAPEPMLAEDFTGIDADSSPLRFRGCFHTPMTLALLTETYVVYDRPTPLVAPSWFSCFDAARIGTDLETGAAVAFLAGRDVHPGVDRVIAVYPDGRAFAWQQLNPSAEGAAASP